MTTPEIPGKKLPDNIGSHLAIGILYVGFLVTHPRRMLDAIETRGMKGISYRRFYENMRPYISYPNQGK